MEAGGGKAGSKNSSQNFLCRWQVAGAGCGGGRQLWGSVTVPAHGVTLAEGGAAGCRPPPSPPRAARGAGSRLVAFGGRFQPNLAEVGGAGSLPGERQGGGGEAAGWAEPLLDTRESSSRQPGQPRSARTDPAWPVSQATGVSQLLRGTERGRIRRCSPPRHRWCVAGGSAVPAAGLGMVSSPAPGGFVHRPRPSNPHRGL